jgi:hypothetical protein
MTSAVPITTVDPSTMPYVTEVHVCVPRASCQCQQCSVLPAATYTVLVSVTRNVMSAVALVRLACARVNLHWCHLVGIAV